MAGTETAAKAPQEETLRDICNENINIASDIKGALDEALGTLTPSASSVATEAAVPSDIIEQAVNAARETRGLLRDIKTTLVCSIINRI